MKYLEVVWLDPVIPSAMFWTQLCLNKLGVIAITSHEAETGDVLVFLLERFALKLKRIATEKEREDVTKLLISVGFRPSNFKSDPNTPMFICEPYDGLVGEQDAKSEPKENSEKPLTKEEEDIVKQLVESAPEYVPAS